jgi:signal transduction histidine kinase
LWGGVAHVFLAVALCLPLVAVTAAIGVSMAHDPSVLNLWLLTLLAMVFVAVVVWASLLPPVRQVEVSAARALFAYDERTLPDVRSPRAWASRRRGAAWLALLVGVGLVVAAAIWYLVPTGVDLVSFPLSGDSTVTWPGVGTATQTGSGWHAMWLVAPGLLALVACLTFLGAAARLVALLAPRMIGPTLSEQVAAAADRESALARANAVARDLHDRLGHTLTAMTVQATAARQLLPTDPGATERALAAIEDLGRHAQADVDGVVRALRDGVEGGTAVSGAPSTVDMAEIASALVQESTLDVELRLPASLPVDHDTAAVARAVIREALTNATRHGTGSASLGIEADTHWVAIEVRNRMRRVVAATPERAGLKGLQERVLLADGQISAGAEGGDSWLLTARLPIGRPTPTR